MFRKLICTGMLLLIVSALPGYSAQAAPAYQATPPVVTLPSGTVSVNENAYVLLDTLATVTDPDSTDFDGGTLTMQVTGNADTNDQLQIRDQGCTAANRIDIDVADVNYCTGAGTWVTIGTWSFDPGTYTLTVSLNANATPAYTRTLVRNLRFRPNDNNTSNLQRTITVTLADGDGGTSTPVTKLVDVTPVNDYPDINGWSTARTYNENAAPLLLSTGATIDDPDLDPYPNVYNLDSGSAAMTVTITNATAASLLEDVLGIRDQGTGAGQIGLSGVNDVTYEGVVIGTYTTGSSPTTQWLTVAFNTSASNAAAQALARNLTYENTSENPTVFVRLVELTTTDGYLGDTSALKNLTVNSVNDYPDINNWSTPDVTYAENAAPVVLDANTTISDPDVPNLSSGSASLTLTITVNPTADDRLGIRNQGTGAGQIGISGTDVTYGGTVIGTFSGGTGATPLTVAFNTNASDAAAQALARNLTFWNVSDNPDTTARGLVLSVTDGTTADTSAVKNLYITPANDGPTIISDGGGATAAVNVLENTAPVTTVVATDPDSPVTYSIIGGTDQGRFSINGTSGALTFNAPLPDFEIPGDANADNVYEVIVQASDGALADTQTINVTVTDIADETGPAITSILRQTPPGSPTAATTVAFRVTFAEDVQNVDPTDFALALGGTATGTINAIVVQSASVYDVVLIGVGGNGTIDLNIAPANNIADLIGNPLGATPAIGTEQTYTIDNTYPTVVFGGSTAPANNSILFVGPTQIVIEFSKDVLADGSPNAANLPANYLLVERGTNAAFNTLACGGASGGLQADDTRITVNSVTYSNNGGAGPFLATLNINNGVYLPVGVYRLYICGTSSIYDPAGNRLNNGLDSALNFTITRVTALPATGFPQGRITQLGPQAVQYASLGDLWLEIPSLGLQMPIVGVPQANGNWDVSWLGTNAGWLEGSAYPTWAGNSVLTGHVWNADNTRGPFASLNQLWYGNRIVVHAFGQEYVYEVRSIRRIQPDGVNAAFQHEELPWLTLLTCNSYNQDTSSYRYRLIVRAVQIEVR